MTITNESDIYYDPFDIEIDNDPHPLWKRMRDEAPLYRNEKYDFYALSRYDDVEKALVDWDTYRSGKGSTLETIMAGFEIPPGMILLEDPPIHDLHRGLLSRVFTPKAMNAIEPKVREFCARTLDPLVGAGRFDFIADLGAVMPMRTIGMLLGIPEEDQVAIRDRHRRGPAPRRRRAEVPTRRPRAGRRRALRRLHRLAGRAPVRRPHDRAPQRRVRGRDGHRRARSTAIEMLTYVMLLAGAGNETTTRLIGWTGKLLAEHPDQRRELAADRSLVPQAIEEILRYEAPSPVQARTVNRDVEYYGQTVPRGQHHGAPQRLRQPRRPPLPRRRPLRHPPQRSTTT